MKSRNFSIYGQWLGLLAALLCFITGISNLFNLSVLVWAIIAIVTGVIVLFLEIQWLLRCFRTATWFEKFIEYISLNWPRAGAYIIAATLQFLSTKWAVTSLIAAGVFLLLAGICFLIAAVRGQTFTGSKTLGAGGMAQMIV